ncbi:MAG: hypothetical protein V1776_01370 [Candidatus Diapherotrites archaeon]
MLRKAPLAFTPAQRKKELEVLFSEIRESKKDPSFRKALREFIEFHTGKSDRFSSSANE